MTLKTVFDYENLDITSDLNLHFANLVGRGVISGGTLTYSSPNAIVSPCYVMSHDGMLVYSDTSVSVTCASGYVNYIVLRAKHSSAGLSTVQFESLTAANYASDSDKDYLIVFGTVDLTGTASISYAVRDGVDTLSRSKFLGVYANLTALATAWPTMTPVLQKDGDFVLILDDSNNEDYPSFYYWVNSTLAWTSAITSNSGLATELTMHIGAVTTAGVYAHTTSDQHAALVGTVGTPSSTNRFVTATDTNLLGTADERAAMTTANVESVEEVSTAPSATNPFIVNDIPVCVSKVKALPATGVNHVSLSRLNAGADLYVGLLGLDSSNRSTARQFFQAEDAYGNGYSDSDGALCVIDVQDSSGTTLNPSTNTSVSSLGYWSPSSIYDVLQIVFNRVVTSGNDVYIRYNGRGTISKLAPVANVIHGIASTGTRSFLESYKIVSTLETTVSLISDGTLSVTGATALNSLSASSVSATGTLSVTGTTTCAALTSSSTITAVDFATSANSTTSSPGYLTGTTSGLYGALDGTSIGLSCNSVSVLSYDSATSNLTLSPTTLTFTGVSALGTITASTITTTGKIIAEYSEIGSSLWNASLAWFGNKSQIGDTHTEHGSGLLVDTTGTVCLTSKSTMFKFGNTSLSSIAVAITYGSSWSTAITGALSATGAVSFSSTLSVSGNTTSARFLSASVSTADVPTFAINSNTGLYGSSTLVGLSINGISYLAADTSTSVFTFGSTSGVVNIIGGSQINLVTDTVTINSTLNVTGATTLSSTLNVTGATTLSSTLNVTGATTLSSTLNVTGLSTLTGGVVGVVDGSDATDGNVGEFKEHVVSSADPVPVANAVAIPINTLTLPAGDWDVEGMANFSLTNVTMSYTDVAWRIGISVEASGSWSIGPTTSLFNFNYSNVTTIFSINPTRVRVSLSTTTAVNLNLIANYTGTDASIHSYGYLSARRVR